MAGERHEVIPGVYYCAYCGMAGTLEDLEDLRRVSYRETYQEKRETD